MNLQILKDKQEMGNAAAETGARRELREALKQNGKASIIVATGASQFEMLEHLVAQPDIRWDQVTAFHLDEYVGLSITHGASFRKYLWERFVSKLPLPLVAFHWINADAGDPAAECKRLGALIKQHSIEVAFVGIGENAHLAFNDPPADFDTEEPYLVVNLDEACRKQQSGEGWFPDLASVPKQAISMSVKQIMKTRQIVCTVPDERKAAAVQKAIEGPVTNLAPASILQKHPNCTLFIDKAAASMLSKK